MRTPRVREERRDPRVQRPLRVLVAVACVAWLAACSGGGGGGGGGGGAPADTAQPQGASSVRLGWAPAAGPVAGYEVYVSREDGPWTLEEKVQGTEVTLHGDPGEQARVIVAAFDTVGSTGPQSQPSGAFTFPGQPAQAAAQEAAGGSLSAAVAPARRLADPAGGAAPDAGAPSDASVDPAELAGGVVWRAGDALRVTDAWLQTRLLFAAPAGAQLVGVGDLDGDGAGDPLWLDAAGQLSYTPLAWLAADPSSTPSVSLGALQGGETVLATGDFDGDGVDDVLVGAADGRVDVWFTVPGAPSELLSLGSAGALTVTGAGDLDANGVDDVVWRGADGSVVMWLLDGQGLAEVATLAPGPDRDVLAVGDFDGDGAAELAARNAAGSVNLLRPLTVPVGLEPTDFVAAPGWTALGAVDVDFDADADLLLLGDDGLLHIGYLPGTDAVALDPASPWQPLALLP